MLWKCDECTTLYAPDAPRCPHCGATGHTEVDSGGQPVGPKAPAGNAKAPAEPPARAAKPGPKAAADA